MANDLNFEDEEWTEFERTKGPTQSLPDAQARITKKANGRRAVAWLAFRGAMSAWFKEHQPRFKVFFGGKSDNLIRIIPDAAAGKFEVTFFKGTARIALGNVDVWPDEERDVTAAEGAIKDGALFLRLPETFTRANRAAAVPAKPVPSKPEAFPITTSAPGLSAAAKAATSGSAKTLRALKPGARVIDHRLTGAVNLGEPPPGRSALDQRRAGGK